MVLSEVDGFLLEQLRAGRAEGWSQFVDRYRGRLLSFARRQLGQDADAEDAVQETFLRFLSSLRRYRGQASLETYLFTILRRHIIDQYRGRPVTAFAPCGTGGGASGGGASGGGGDLVGSLPAADPTASWHARLGELNAQLEEGLGQVIGELTERLRAEPDFTQLQIVELLFAAQWPNGQIAALLGVPAGQVGVVKHRWLKRLAHAMAQCGLGDEDPSLREALLGEGTLLTRVWEQQRPSCPKRSTLGQHLLGTLEPRWHEYVRFHLDTLGCRFCRANLDDLIAQTQARGGHPGASGSTAVTRGQGGDGDRNPSGGGDGGGAALRERIMQSTAGFFRRQ